MALPVLPRPKKVTERKGTFRFLEDTIVALSPRADSAERLAGVLLADTAADLGAIRPAVERHGKPAELPGPVVQMFLLGRDERLCPSIARLAGSKLLGREGYALDITPRRVLVAGNTSAGLFYGAQTLIQLLEPARTRKRTGSPALPCCRIVDWPDFAFRGFMLDVSRFRVPCQETLADLVFRLAACKINVLQLYVEHTFRCRRHPEYSEGVSPLTAEQLAELDELCAALHIELQANQNSLGHQQHMLSQPEFAHLAERPADAPPALRADGRPLPQPWSFRLDSDEVYSLLDDIYAEHLAAVRSPLANLGCDEAWDMGGGRSRTLVERKGKVRAFVDHVRRIARLARNYGKQTMIWEDMIRHNPEVLGMLPKDVIPVFWHYEAEPAESYWKIWANSGRRHWMAPGCCGWTSIFAQNHKAWANIHWMTAAGRKGRAEGILNTEWGDNGNFQTLPACFFGLAVGAELSWNSTPIADQGDFDRRFARAVFADRTGRMGRIYRLLSRTNTAFRKVGYQGIPFVLYWADFPHANNWSSMTRLPQPSLAEVRRCARYARQAQALLEQVRRDPPDGADDRQLQELLSAADQTLFACRKAELADRVRKALAGGRPLPTDLKRQVRRLAREWDRQKREFRRVWLLTNEPSQIDYRLKLYDQRRRDFARLLR